MSAISKSQTPSAADGSSDVNASLAIGKLDSAIQLVKGPRSALCVI